MPRIGVFVMAAFLSAIPCVFAQSPELLVKQANDAILAAARAGDKAVYAKATADDLRWVGPDGVVLTKA